MPLTNDGVSAPSLSDKLASAASVDGVNTSCGLSCIVVLPMPSWPLLLSPQQYTAPVVPSTQV